MLSLPPLPEHELLADLCREAAAVEGLQPAAVEKDFYLTRLIWALAQHFEDRLLLKGGTLLSKVDLGFRRMSEDVDLVIPWKGPRSHRGINAAETNRVRDALKILSPAAGLRFVHFDGSRFKRHAQVIWELSYDSAFGPQSIDVEVALRPVLRTPRRAYLSQLLRDPLAGDYDGAYCWALDADEARAEKTRAAFTRTEIRDFYDLEQLARLGTDFRSRSFKELLDRKLAELSAPPLALQPPFFGLTAARRRTLEAQARTELPTVLRVDEAPFNLDAMLACLNALWEKEP